MRRSRPGGRSTFGPRAFGEVPLSLALAAFALAGCSDAVAQSPNQASALDLALVRTITGSPARDQVLVVDADGRAPARVLASPKGVEGVGGLSWTPDGRLLLVGVVGERLAPTYRDTRTDLFTIAPEGAGGRRLTETGDVQGAAMSPDGATAAIARRPITRRFDQSSSRLWLMDADGGGLRPLLPSKPGRHDLPGAWSPDGRQLVFTRRINRLDRNGDLVSGNTVWVVNVDGTGARRIAEGRSPAWSPDGTRIAFASARDRNGEIYGADTRRVSAELYTVAADGSDPRRITRTADDEDVPAWSTDGRWLAFVREGATGPLYADTIWTMRPDGSCARPIASDRAGVVWYRGASWRPGAAPIAPECGSPGRLARVPAVPADGIHEARRFRASPLYWLGPTWRGRSLVSIGSGQPNPQAHGFIYGDCREIRGNCGQLQFQISDVCWIGPPTNRGPGANPALRTRIRGAPAYLYFGSRWEVYTGRVVIRVHVGGREGRRLIAALRGLNAPARGLRPGRPFPPPIAGALERRLPCPTPAGR